jgi:urease accessory protein
MTGHPLPPRLLPIALGEAAVPLGLARAEVAQLFLQSFAANLCLIATRHIPLGQTEGQAVLARLQPDIVEIGDRAALAETEDLGSATLAADLAAMQHETMDVRIFRT